VACRNTASAGCSRPGIFCGTNFAVQPRSRFCGFGSFEEIPLNKRKRVAIAKHRKKKAKLKARALAAK